MEQIEKLKNKFQTKLTFIHKLQVQISKIQKDKITMQEKHSLSLKINKQKINNLEKIIGENNKNNNDKLNQLQSIKDELNQTKIKFKDICCKQKKDETELLKFKEKYNKSQKEVNKCQEIIEKIENNVNNKENGNDKILELETKITQLKFEREDLEIKCNKLQKKLNDNKNEKLNISSRNDPQLQNLLDSMKFIINKLKKENQTL